MKRVVLTFMLLAGVPWIGADEPQQPIKIDRTEQVKVKWILIDVVALDREGRTVRDLTIDDFDVMVGFEHVQPRSLDIDCGEYAPVENDSTEVAAALARTREKRVVLLLDYRHMSNPPQMIRQLTEMLQTEGLNGVEHMVVSLTDNLRIHQRFTDDVDEVIVALDELSKDPAIYASQISSFTERRTFDALLDLYNLMEFVPGRKVVMMMTGDFAPAGWNYDVEYRLLAAMASRTRTSLYPVDSAGLRPVEALGGNPFLARLANETGGRFTRGTNDIARGLQRAQDDLTCRYTLGVHDPRPEEDRRKRLRVFIRRPGVRAHYPSGHMQRSHREMQQSLIRTARISSEGYDDGGVSLEVIAMRPVSRSRWDVRLVLETPPELIERGADHEPWWFGGVIRRANGTTIRSFRQRIALDAPAVQGAANRGLHYSRFRLPAGLYTVHAYAYHESMRFPLGFTRAFEIREVPRDRPFAMEPLLVRAVAEEDPGRGRAPFPPVPGEILPNSEGLGVYFQICDFSGQKGAWSSVTHAIQNSSPGGSAVEYPADELQFVAGGQSGCRGRFDPIDYDALGLRTLEWTVHAESRGRDLSTHARRVWKLEQRP